MRIATNLCGMVFSLSMVFVAEDPLASHLFAFGGGVWLMNLLNALVDRIGP